jgi:hypothetical protein
MGALISGIFYAVASAAAGKLAGDGFNWFQGRNTRREDEINSRIEEALAAKKEGGK